MHASISLNAPHSRGAAEKLALARPAKRTCADEAPYAELPLPEFEYAGDVDAVDWWATASGQNKGGERRAIVAQGLRGLRRRWKRSGTLLYEYGRYEACWTTGL